MRAAANPIRVAWLFDFGVAAGWAGAFTAEAAAVVDPVSGTGAGGASLEESMVPAAWRAWGATTVAFAPA